MSTILIVDDNKKNLQILGNVLHEKTYRVAMAMDGPSALKLAAKLLPDLIVLDIMMPGMDGFEVCSILKSQAETKEIPIIFLTAKVDLDDIVKGFKVGGADYVTKPFKKEELIARIKTQLEISESRIKIANQARELEEVLTQKDKLCSIVTSDIEKALIQLMDIHKLLLEPKNVETQSLFQSKKIESKTETAYQILENILWWAKIQSKKVKPVFSIINVSDCINKSIKHLIPKASEKNISIENNANASVLADEQLLQKIIKNIVHNALLYSNEKTTIKCESFSNNDTSTIIISDECNGINSEKTDNIFNHSNIQNRTGYESDIEMGLKLSIELVKLMNASLNIETEINKGTLTSITFNNQKK